MKKNRLFLPFLLFVMLVVSCTQKGEGKHSESKAEKVKSEAGVGLNDTAELFTAEEFDDFLQEFSIKESFQLNRIKFPIKAIVPDADHVGMAPMEETIGRYEWEMLDLTYDSTFLTRPFDQYYQVVRFQNDSAIVEIRGINNGIYADYFFELIENRWYLVSLYEASF